MGRVKKMLIQDTVYFERLKIDSERHYPASPEFWQGGGHRLVTASDYDIEYFGRGTIRILTSQTVIPTLAIKIHVTGRKELLIRVYGTTKIKVKFEFLRDGESSEFSKGFVYLFRDV